MLIDEDYDDKILLKGIGVDYSHPSGEIKIPLIKRFFKFGGFNEKKSPPLKFD